MDGKKYDSLDDLTIPELIELIAALLDELLYRFMEISK